MHTKEKFVELVGALTHMRLVTGCFETRSWEWLKELEPNLHVFKMPVTPMTAPRLNLTVDQMFLVLPFPETFRPWGGSSDLKQLSISVRGFDVYSGQYFDETSLLEDGKLSPKRRLAVHGIAASWDDLGDEGLELMCDDLKRQLRALTFPAQVADDLFRLYPNLRRILFSRTDGDQTAA
jgi:hypothetical protein